MSNHKDFPKKAFQNSGKEMKKQNVQEHIENPPKIINKNENMNNEGIINQNKNQKKTNLEKNFTIKIKKENPKPKQDKEVPKTELIDNKKKEVKNLYNTNFENKKLENKNNKFMKDNENKDNNNNNKNRNNLRDNENINNNLIEPKNKNINLREQNNNENKIQNNKNFGGNKNGNFNKNILKSNNNNENRILENKNMINDKLEKQSGNITPRNKILNVKNEEIKSEKKKIIINKNDGNKKIENKDIEKEIKPEKIINSILPMRNEKGNHNCFINVLIQILFQSKEFKNNYLKLQFNNDENNPLYQLQKLFLSYSNLQKSGTPDILDVITFRKSLSKIFPDIQEGICGDPVEVLNHILNAIHLFSVNNNNKLNEFNPSNFNCNLSCLSHKFSSIKLKENLYCSSCNINSEIPYDGNYFVYEIFAFEILELLHGKTNQSFKNKLFTFSKDLNNKVPEETKVSDCVCEKPNIKKELIQCGNINPYLIINLTWDNLFPKMTDILKMYNLISTEDENKNLFTLKDESKMNRQYYLYAIIVFYNYHYTCAINIDYNWYFIDDYKIKEFKSYKELIINLITNHYHPIVLFYSIYNQSKEIDKNEVFNSEEYNKIFKLCYDFDTKIRGENVSRIYSNKVDKAIEYFSNSKRGSKISSNTLSSNNESWVCIYCKSKNPIINVKCWCCNRVSNILLVNKSSSTTFNLLKDSNSGISNSGLFLNDIPTVNSIKINVNPNNQNLRENSEFFLDKNTSSEFFRSKSIKINNNDDDKNSNDYILNTHQRKFQLQKRKSNNRYNSKKTNDDDFTIFGQSSNENVKNINNTIDNVNNKTIWYCLDCGIKNDNNFCPQCGKKKC